MSRTTVVSLIALIALAAPAGAQENLLPNPSFEQGVGGGATGWDLNFWEPGGRRSSGDVSDTVAHSGSRSVHMEGYDPGCHAYWTTRNIPVEPGRRYVLTAWALPHGVIYPTSYCRIHVGFQDADGQIIQDEQHHFASGWAYETLAGYSGWTQFGLEVVPPPDAVTAAVVLRFVGPGEAWFDDVSLVQSETAEVIHPPPDLTRQARYSAPPDCSGETRVTLTLTNPYAATLSGLVIAGGDERNRVVATDPVDIEPGESLDLPVTVRFAPELTARDVRVLFEARGEVEGRAVGAQMLGSFSVVAEDVMAAISEDRWGPSEHPAPASAPPVEVLGTLLQRNGEPRFTSSWTSLDLKPGDGPGGVVVRVNGTADVHGAMQLAWECLDYFFRGEQGAVHVDVPEGRSELVRLPLSDHQLERMYAAGRDAGAARFRVICRLLRDGELLHRFQAGLPVTPDLPDVPDLGPLATERTDDLPVFGRLRLVDEVLCGDPDDEHLMRQGGRGLDTKYTSDPLDYYGGGDRLNFDWWLRYRDDRDEFTRVEEILGRPCRITDRWGWFAYLVGRGALTPGAHYVMVIEYPEDVSRNFLIWTTLDHSACCGFHTGSALGDPHSRQRFMQRTDLPLSGEYRRHYLLITPYSAEGWVAIHSMGEVAAPFSEGIAVHAIRIYELGDDEAVERLIPEPTEPEGLPHRLIGFIQEDATPRVQTLRKCAFMGLNMYAPLALSYGGGASTIDRGYVGWDSEIYSPDNFRNPWAQAAPPYYHMRPGVCEPIFAAADRLGMQIVPLLEYAGSGHVPEEALAVWPDGSPQWFRWGTKEGADGLRTWNYREQAQCIDMAHPAVGEDMAALMAEVEAAYGDHDSFAGVVLTHRFSAWQISYSDYELRRFAEEYGLRLPGENAGRWVYDNHLDDFYEFHYRCKRENLLRAARALHAADPSDIFAILNYNGGDDNLHFGTPLYWWDKQQGDEFLVPGAVSLPDLSGIHLGELMEDYTRPDIAAMSVGMDPPLYRSDVGVWNLAIAHYPWLCGNREFLDYFRTGEGCAVCFWWIYNEDAFRNHPEIGWNCPGLNGNEPAGRYCMLDEVLAMATGDPFIMAVRIGQMNRGFPEYAREFAMAYRALPAVRSEIIDACDDPEVVIRRYETEQGVFLAVINTGLGPEVKALSLDTDALGGGRLCDLVTGERLAARDGDIDLQLPPVCLRAFTIQ